MILPPPQQQPPGNRIRALFLFQHLQVLPISATKTSQASGANAGAPLPAATIESVHSINFARNLKEYRSPKLAMLMSLILPGAGQVYAKSNLWAAAFGVIEVGLISTGVALSAKSKTVSNNAHAFANQHYDTNAYKQYTSILKVIFTQ